MVRALYVTPPSCPPRWLAELLTSDRAMTVHIEIAVGGHSGFKRLREETFDVILVRHTPVELNAIDWAEAHRATGAEDPLVVIGQEPEHRLAPLCYEVGADAYLAHSTTARQLIWTLARSIECHTLRRDNKRLSELDRKRARLEHSEAERLLEQQRSLLDGLQELSTGGNMDRASRPTIGAARISHTLDVPASLVSGYRDLLRAYLIMGSGSQAAETAVLADSLAANGISAPQLMQLHVHVLEGTLQGLGGRGARHVMSRADLLVLEVMAQLVERYRPRGAREARDSQIRTGN